MARHKRIPSLDVTVAIDPELVLLGDVRRAPVQVQQGSQTFSPDVALWLRANDGRVAGSLIAEPGHPAETLLEALLQSVLAAEGPDEAALPGRAVLFDQALADELGPQLQPLGIEVFVQPRFEPFDLVFQSLFSYLEQAEHAKETLELPNDVLKPLLGAAERLWKARPWDYVYDHPPFLIAPRESDGQAFYASILGANGDVLGVALYTSLGDYENSASLVESSLLEGEAGASPEQLRSLLDVFHDRTFLVFFDLKDEIQPGYREQLARAGWSRRFSVVPTFNRIGGGEEPGEPTAAEAGGIAVAVDALAVFCQSHRSEIANGRFPVEGEVEVSPAGRATTVEVSIPPPAAPSSEA